MFEHQKKHEERLEKAATYGDKRMKDEFERAKLKLNHKAKVKWY